MELRADAESTVKGIRASAFWLLSSFVFLAPVIYFLGIGPAMYFFGYFPDSARHFLGTIYSPLIDDFSSSSILGWLLDRYLDLWGM